MQSRNLGYFETLLYHAHQRGISQMTFWIKIQAPITQTMIINALRTIYVKHPLLRSIIKKYDGILKYEIRDDFNMIPIEFIEVKDDEGLREIIYNESKQQLPTDICNWTAKIACSNLEQQLCYDLILHFSHVVVDALSVINLIQELITHLDQQILGQDIVSKNQLLYGNVEQYLIKKITINEFLDRQVKSSENCNIVQLTKLELTERSTAPYILATIKDADLNKIIAEAKSKKYH